MRLTVLSLRESLKSGRRGRLVEFRDPGGDYRPIELAAEKIESGYVPSPNTVFRAVYRLPVNLMLTCREKGGAWLDLAAGVGESMDEYCTSRLRDLQVLVRASELDGAARNCRRGQRGVRGSDGRARAAVRTAAAQEAARYDRPRAMAEFPLTDGGC